MAEAGLAEERFAPTGVERGRRRGRVFEDLAGEGKGVDDVGDSAGAQHGRTIHEMEVQMGHGGIAGVAEVGEDLAAFDVVADLHFDRARLQVGVEGEGAVAQALNDVVAADVVDGEALWVGICGRPLIGEIIEGLGNDAVGGGRTSPS